MFIFKKFEFSFKATMPYSNSLTVNFTVAFFAKSLVTLLTYLKFRCLLMALVAEALSSFVHCNYNP